MNKNVRKVLSTRNDIINAFKKLRAKESEQGEEGQTKSVSLDDLLYISVEKLKEIKKGHDEDKGFKKDENIEKGRNALEGFVNDIIDRKIINKKDLVNEYLEKVSVYKNKIKVKSTYKRSNFRKLLNYIERIEFAFFGEQIPRS